MHTGLITANEAPLPHIMKGRWNLRQLESLVSVAFKGRMCARLDIRPSFSLEYLRIVTLKQVFFPFNCSHFPQNTLFAAPDALQDGLDILLDLEIISADFQLKYLLLLNIV